MKNDKEISSPNKWKYEYHNKNNVADFIYDLFDDTIKFLKKNKHIQDIQYFFKKINKPFKVKSGYIKLKTPDVFEEIKINEIKEIKIEQKVEQKKKPKVITLQEPTTQQVIDALNVKTDYVSIITDYIVNAIMFIVIIVVGFFEVIQYLFKRLIQAIKYLSTLPYKQIFNIVFKIIVVGGSLSLMIIAFYAANNLKLSQKNLEDKRVEDRKYVDDGYTSLKNRIEKIEGKQAEIDSNTYTVKHVIDKRIITDKYGNIISSKEKIR